MNHTRQIHYRLNELEYDKLAASATQFGLSTSNYAKKIALKSKLVKPKFSHADCLKLNLSLTRIGNNLNQLSQVANQSGNLPINQELKALQLEVNQLWQQLK